MRRPRGRAGVTVLVFLTVVVFLTTLTGSPTGVGGAVDAGEHRQAAETQPDGSSQAVAPSPATFFEPNRGQARPGVAFLAYAPGYRAFLSPTAVTLGLAPSPREGGAVLRMSLAGADPLAEATASHPLEGRVSHFLGKDPGSWLSGIPTFGRVRFEDVYRGIDLVYRSGGDGLEYDFVVEPGADPALIGLSFDGADDVRIESNGDLAVLTEGGFLRHRVPIAYQDVDGVRRHVEATFAEDSGGLVRFTVGHHDRSLPLVIDPVIVYARQFGDATSGGNEEAIGIQADAAGNAFVTGFTTSSDFPVTAGAFDTSIGGLYDAFVMKLDPAGNIVWATFLGGSQWEQGRGIALDAAGAVYVTGVTQSPNFPTRRPVQGAFGGGFDAFVTKLNPQGSSLVYSTFLGGSSWENSDDSNFLARQAVGDLAVDGDGHAVVTGYTQSSDFPTANALQPEIGGGVCPPGQIPCQDVFISKLSRRGSAFVYSTFLGGTGSEYGHGIAADANGAAYVTGEVIGSDFPTRPGAFQPTPQGGTDYFVTKINGTGSTLAYSTYLGGEGSEFAGSEIAVDARGRAYVTGGTFSFGFPTTPGAFQREKAGDMDVTVTKMNATGSAPVYSTYVGGHDDESGVGIAVDAQGRASFTGLTTSGGTYPEVGELESCSALPEGIATTLNAAGSDVVFSTCLGNVLREGASIDEQDQDLFVGGFTLAGGGATDGMAVRIAE